jgi:FkbM family methyltransferase
MKLFLARKVLKVFDYVSQRKITNFLKLILKKNLNTVLDVGAHHGETILNLINNFNIKKIYAFEASNINFLVLKKQLEKIVSKTEIVLINHGVGEKEGFKNIKQTEESSSSTYSDIDENSSYFMKKKFFLYNKKKYFKNEETKLITLNNFFDQNKLQDVDYLKIDTEGYEFFVLKGLDKYIKNVKVIHFEHHYDNMLIKKYKFSDIHNLLINNNFYNSFKIKMFFRKSFEYVYLNNFFFRKIN